MNVRIKAIHFEIADRLVNFINKKTERIGRRNPEIDTFDVNLNLIKPETALNKEVTIRVAIPQNGEIVASKTADTFEEAFDVAVEAVEKQLEKRAAPSPDNILPNSVEYRNGLQNAHPACQYRAARNK